MRRESTNRDVFEGPAVEELDLLLQLNLSLRHGRRDQMQTAKKERGDRSAAARKINPRSREEASVLMEFIEKWIGSGS